MLGVWTPTQLSYGKTRGTDSLSPGLFFKINVTATPQYRVGAQWESFLPQVNHGAGPRARP